MPASKAFCIYIIIQAIPVIFAAGEKDQLLTSAAENPKPNTKPATGNLLIPQKLIMDEIPPIETMPVTKPKKRKASPGFFKKLGMLLGCVKGSDVYDTAPQKKHKPVMNEELQIQRFMKFTEAGNANHGQTQKYTSDPFFNPESGEDNDHQQFFDMMASKSKPVQKKPLSQKEKAKALRERVKKLSDQEKKALTKHHESCGKTILSGLNEFRKKNGLGQLEWKAEVYDTIQSHTTQMAIKMNISHDNFTDRFAKIKGIKKGAENVGMSGYPLKTDKEVSDRLMNGWIASKGHRANMVIPTLTHAAIDCVYSELDEAWYSTMFLVTL
jgi:uncharacterized protein YkwD